MSETLICNACGGYGKERCSHCEDGRVDCWYCDGTGANPAFVSVKEFRDAAAGCDWILKQDDGHEVVGRKTHDGKTEVRYADFVFKGAIGGELSLIEDLP